MPITLRFPSTAPTLQQVQTVLQQSTSNDHQHNQLRYADQSLYVKLKSAPAIFSRTVSRTAHQQGAVSFVEGSLVRSLEQVGVPYPEQQARALIEALVPIDFDSGCRVMRVSHVHGLHRILETVQGLMNHYGQERRITAEQTLGYAITAEREGLTWASSAARIIQAIQGSWGSDGGMSYLRCLREGKDDGKSPPQGMPSPPVVRPVAGGELFAPFMALPHMEQPAMADAREARSSMCLPLEASSVTTTGVPQDMAWIETKSSRWSLDDLPGVTPQTREMKAMAKATMAERAAQLEAAGRKLNVVCLSADDYRELQPETEDYLRLVSQFHEEDMFPAAEREVLQLFIDQAWPDIEDARVSWPAWSQDTSEEDLDAAQEALRSIAAHHQAVYGYPATSIHFDPFLVDLPYGLNHKGELCVSADHQVRDRSFPAVLRDLVTGMTQLYQKEVAMKELRDDPVGRVIITLMIHDLDRNHLVNVVKADEALVDLALRHPPDLLHAQAHGQAVLEALIERSGSGTLKPVEAKSGQSAFRL